MIGLNIRARSSSSLSLRNGQFQSRDLCRIAFEALLLIAEEKLIKLNIAQKLSKLTAFLYNIITMIFEIEYIQ
jgi:hypothetical protein